MGSNQQQPRRLSQEEMERIKALPVRTFRVGGELRSGFYDEETRQFYETVDNKLTGRVARVNLPTEKAANDMKKEPDKTDGSDKEGEATGEVSEETNGEVEKGGKKKKRLIIGAIAGGAVLLMVVAALFTGGDPESTGPNNPDVDPNVVTDQIHVVQVVKDLLPGHVLTPEDVQECVLDVAAYNEAVLYGRNFCTYDSLDKLVGNYLTEYIPANQYLEQDSIKAASPFGINPWSSTEQGTTFITVPIAPDMADKTSFGFGSVVDMTVRRTVSSQVAVGDEPGYEDVPGVTHTSTVGTTSRTEEITISGLYVCDILNGDNESLYETYAAYMGIPLGNRLDYLTAALEADETLWTRLTPAYVKVRVTDAQSVAIGDVNAEGTTVALHDANSQFINTDTQAEFASESTAIKTTLYQAYAELEQKKADDLAALQQQQQEQAAQTEAPASGQSEAS